MTSTTLTISAARRLAAASPAFGCAIYYRAYDEDGALVDRAHTPASTGTYNMRLIVEHLEAGRRVEIREGSDDGLVRFTFTAIEPGVGAAI